jgi:repressor LexA
MFWYDILSTNYRFIVLQTGESTMMARRKSKVLSNRHKKILQVLERFQKTAGYPPSIREIGDNSGITSTSLVNFYLNQLKDWGYIERDEHVSRGIRLMRPFSEVVAPLAEAAASAVQGVRQAVDELLHVPILGRIVAGSPVPVPPSDFSYFDAESMVDVAASLLPAKEKTNDLFALEVEGDSMIDAMVYDGDLIILKPSKEARNGEMVAIWLKDRDETTLKYFYLENGRVRLQPANPTMKPIYIDDPATVDVQGKVVMVIRQVKGPVV